MATQNINIGVNVSDNGTTAKATKNVENLHTVLKQTQKTASSINVGGTAAAGTVGGTSGSRTAAARAAPTGSQAMMSGEEYGRLRGSANVTGASARDFANQAQGLGGLVRLYATYAANIFAVSAAFTALKTAADTTNLVRGLDTLGAASGRSLGTLSKQLVAATDGAVSLREAMTATAQTSSAGMSGENIKRLAVVAKNASLALGVAMPDALNRLSRGIVKLEPELLDELGLFTKIGTATEKYALEIGKSASSLTDFERRQAFANAVLEEGEKKFSALSEAAANPYDKLLANLKNVAQTGLELVNTVLTPIISLLSQSPAALGASLLAIGGILLKQALPALGEFKKGLQLKADRDLAAAKNRTGDAVKAREQLNKLIEAKVEASADVELRKFEELEAKLYGVRESGIRKRGSLYKILEKDIVDITDKEIAAAERSVREFEKKAKTDTSLAPVAQLERDTLEQLKNVINSEQQLTVVKLQNRKIVEEQLAQSGILARVQREAANYELAAKKSALVSNAAYNSSLLGIRSSWQLFRLEVESANLSLSRTEKSLLLIRGAAATLTGVITTLGGAINKAFGIFALLATVFAAVDMIFSSNAKEMQKFSSALDAAAESSSNAKRTIEALKDSSGIEKNTIDSTLALSNALTELADSAKSAINGARLAKQEAGAFDKFWNLLLIPVNLDIDSKLSKTFAQQVRSAIELLKREGLDQDFEQAIKTTLGVESLNDVSGAFENASDDVRAALVKILQDSKTTLGNIASELQGFKTSSDNALKSYKEFLQSTADTNPLFKLGESLVQLSLDMQKFADSSRGIAKAFDELVKNPEKAGLFGKGFLEEFAKLRPEFERQKRAVDDYDTRIRALTTSLKEQEETLTRVNNPAFVKTLSSYEKSEAGIQRNTLPGSILATKQELDKIQLRRADLDTTAIDRAQKLFSEGIESALKRGLAFATRALQEANIAAATTISKAATSILTGERKVEAEANIQRQELNSRLKLIDSNIDLVNVQDQLVAELRLANALAEQQQDPNNAKLQQQVDFAKISVTIANGVSNALNELEGTLTKEQQQQLNAQKTQQKIRATEQRATQIRLGGEVQGVNISEQIARERANLQQQTELGNLVLQINKLYQDRQNIITSISGVTSKALIAEQGALELAQLQAKQAQEIKRIDSDIRLNQDMMAKDPANEDKYKREIALLKDKKAIATATNKLEADVQGAQTRQKQLQFELDQVNRNFEVRKSSQDLINTLEANTLDQKKQEFALEKSRFDLSEQIVIRQESELELSRLQLENSNAVKQAEEALAQKQEEFQLRRRALLDSNISADDERMQRLNQDEARQQTLTNNTLIGLQAQFNSKQAILEKTREINLEQERFNELIKTSASVSESLATVFKRFGETLGGLVSVFTEIAVNSEKRAASEETLQKRLSDAQAKQRGELLEFGAVSQKTSDEVSSAEKDLGDQRKKNAKEQMTDDLKLVKSAKGLFKEKTLAYKTINAVEKAMHLSKLAMQAKELAFELFGLQTSTAAKVSKEAASTALTLKGIGERLSGYATAIFGESVSELGPIKGAAIAGTLIATMYALFGKGGGGGGAFVPTAEQAQEVQGTGLAFDRQGNRVETGRGVFGDVEAKNTAIENSLKTLAENSVDGLSYDNRALRALEDIRDAVSSTAKSLYGVPGLRSGSMFGTQEGTSGFGGVLGFFGNQRTTEIKNSGLLISGTLKDLSSSVMNTASQFFEDVTKSKKNLLGKTKTWNERNLKPITDDVAGFIETVFTNATEYFQVLGQQAGFTAKQISEIIDPVQLRAELSTRGLKGEELEQEVSAVIGDLLDQVALALFDDLVKAYQEFGETATATVTRVLDTNKKVIQQIKNITGQDLDAELALTGIVPEAKKAISYSLQQVLTPDINDLYAKLAPLGERYTSILDNSLIGVMQQTWSSEGFSSELVTALSPELLNKAFSKLSQDELASMKKAGVDFVNETVTVISDGITTSFSQVDLKAASIAITEDLVELAGGIENFLSQSNFFAENFLTEAERLAPVQKSVTEEMKRLGYESVTTRQGFKQLVQSLDLTVPAQRETYTSLMRVAEGFYEITEAAGGFDPDAIAASLKTLQKRILELTGTPEQILAAQRAETLAETDASLRSTQEYVFALEDVKTAQDALTNARKREGDSLKNTITNLKRYAESLRNFSQSLLLGPQTTLTPQQRYQEARRQLDQVLATATGPATTADEIAARDAAISQIQSSSSAFLEASRTFNASSDQYTEDFNFVQRALTTTASAIDAQIPIAEKQLTALGLVNESVLSVADAIAQLATAMRKAELLAPVSYADQARAGGRAVFSPENIVFGAQGRSTTTQQFSQEIQAWMTSAAQTYLDQNPDVKAAYAENNYGLSMVDFVNTHYSRFGKGEQRGATTMTMISQLYDTFTKDWKLTSMQVAQIMGTTQQSVLDYFAVAGLPAFARGTNYVPSDMIAQIHEGERIIPAADNAELMQSINNRNETNRVLVTEIKNLRREVQQLREQQAKETGAIIVANFDAQLQNAEQVGTAIADSIETAAWTKRVEQTAKLK